jgi:hypothetical protein
MVELFGSSASAPAGNLQQVWAPGKLRQSTFGTRVCGWFWLFSGQQSADWHPQQGFTSAA